MKTFLNKLFFLMLLFPLSALAQSVISGTVSEKSTSLPLPGVNVVVVGTSNGVSTDLDGNFELSGVKNGDKISFTYIGFQEQIITYSGQKSLSISMVEDADILQEVVVVGYGAVKKKDNTGAVSKVTAENLNQGTLVDPMQALQGKAAGVNITKQGGDPNSSFNVRIRGAAGFTASGSPLYVVDGVRGVDPTTIAPDDILSYDILKDAASTAIYGADGANGVIFITTKRGKKGKPQFDYNAYVAVDEVANRLDLQSADSYRNFIQNNGISFTDNGANTDWQDQIFQNGISNNHTFAMSGASDNTNYRASISYMDFDGVIKGSSKERTVARLNVTQKAFDEKLTIEAGMSQTFERNTYVPYGSNGNNDVLFQGFQRLPTDPVFNPDGSYFETNSTFQYYNPLARIDLIDNVRNFKFFTGNLNLDYEIIPGLNARVAGSYLRKDYGSKYFEQAYSNYYPGQTTPSEFMRGYGRRNYDNWDQKLLEATLTYRKTFNDVHNFTALLGYSYRGTTWDGFQASGSRPASNLLGADNLQNFDELVLGNNTSYAGERLDIGYFGRLMYDYDSRYYLTAMIRRDGSSVFGPNNQWGYFPSVQAAWSIAEEDFIKNSSADFINTLKLRASYGISGNSNIDSYLWMLRVTPTSATDPETGNAVVGFNWANNANPDLQWDENHEYNIGLDFGLWNNRLSGSVEYYQKDLKNMLIQNTNIPIETHFSNTTYMNGGEMRNEGIEVTLNGDIIRGNDFTWSSTLTYTRNTQEVVSLGNDEYAYSFMNTNWVSAPGMVGVYTQRIEPGQQLGSYFGFEYAGTSQGRWLIRGNDGELHFLDEVTNSDEHKKYIGNALPDFELGWSHYFKYKNWDLSMSWRAVVGHEIYNVTNMVFGNPDYVGSRNVTDEALILRENGVGGAYNTLSYYLEDASFLRLDNINLGYNFDVEKFSKYITKMRVYASANNVLTFTNYGGLDPEFNVGGTGGFGNDQYNVYPKTRTFTFGINVSF